MSMSRTLERAKRALRYFATGRLDYVAYAMSVRWRGLDFAPVSLEKLGLSYSHSEHHSASGGVFLADVLKQMDIEPGSRVVDLGCGKGSALCTLANFPFDEVAGVELSGSLARIAVANGRKLGLRTLAIHVSDAADFTDLDRFSHIYMFNPFPSSVMATVMTNLAASLRREPRRATVIYFFPVCHDVLIESDLFETVTEVDVNSSHPYHIYVHENLGAASHVA